ncbi:methyl-accepting chemotaxis protein [Paraburkholderia phosphatilytica]|uniref:methyl-accepting chemotaxis protein n=1 Tax=Paraburkholderia phosphatilytica TaxID=2282883 RepID=UPI000E4BA7B2|nr:methyl-accepting chemotaxis protein [Paraburkholderia phosphatilytica]
MAFLSNFKIGPRLGAGFAIVLLLLCAVGGVGLLQASRIYGGTREIGLNWLPSVETLGTIRSAADDVRRTSLRAFIATDAADRQTARDQHAQSIARFATAFDAYSKLVSSPEEQRLADGIKSTWAQYMEIDAKVQSLVDAGDASAADARALAGGPSANAFNAVRAVIDEDVKLNRDGANAEIDHARASYHSAMAWTIGLIALAMALGAGIAVAITASITGPIRRSVAIAETVARGDLTATIEVHGADEMSQLLGALRHMNERLVDLVSRVLSSSEGIATASAEIASGNTDLSQRTEEQAASLEETAASMEELTATVKQNAENANQGNALAANASETAVRGGEVVGRVVDTMQEISSSSEQVAQIISVIEGIAFQTNILALNAAVEAARAGEQGRGFAVVAGEVRTLAQRSATAAKEIKDLITVSVERVNTGTALVDDAGRTMTEIVQAVKRVADLMGEISAASGEQHHGIEQVNTAVMQMDEMTQQNAALVEEASAAAQSMASQSAALRELVSVFKVDAAAARAVAPAVTNAKAKTGAGSAPRAVAKARVSATPRPVVASRSATKPAPKAAQRPAATSAAASAATADADWQTF